MCIRDSRVPATTKGQSAELTFAIYNAYGDLQTQKVTVTQGAVVQMCIRDSFRPSFGAAFYGNERVCTIIWRDVVRRSRCV